MTKSQCYAEIAQKQSKIANYNTKIEKLNSEMLPADWIKRLSVLHWRLQENRMK